MAKEASLDGRIPTTTAHMIHIHIKGVRKKSLCIVIMISLGAFIVGIGVGIVVGVVIEMGRRENNERASAEKRSFGMVGGGGGTLAVHFILLLVRP